MSELFRAGELSFRVRNGVVGVFVSETGVDESCPICSFTEDRLDDVIEGLIDVRNQLEGCE